MLCARGGCTRDALKESLYCPAHQDDGGGGPIRRRSAQIRYLAKNYRVQTWVVVAVLALAALNPVFSVLDGIRDGWNAGQQVDVNRIVDSLIETNKGRVLTPEELLNRDKEIATLRETLFVLINRLSDRAARGDQVAQVVIKDLDAGKTASLAKFVARDLTNSSGRPVNDAELAAVARIRAGAGVRIFAVHANPVGSDPGTRAVTLVNATSSPVDLNGWELQNRSETYMLSGVIGPAERRTVVIPQGTATLDNPLDVVRLIDRVGNQVDAVAVGSSEAGGELGFVR